MRRLDLLVPHWKEIPDEMEPLLDSVKVQQGVDIAQVGVVIAYDGPEASELPLDRWRKAYPFAIEDVHPDKGGVSHARNAAFDASSAEYVMYCDADDMLCDALGLGIVFREMDTPPSERELMSMGIDPKSEGPGFELLISCFREETRDPSGKPVYVNHDNDQTFCHGKVMSRRFLEDNHIRYRDDLHVHEDSFFQILCREVAKPWRARYCPMPFYLWKWRDASVCRHDPLYIQKTYNDMLDSNDALVDELTRRSMPERAAQYVAFMTFDAFYTMNKEAWLDINNREYRDAVEERFGEYFRKHRPKWESLTPQERVMMSNVVRQRSVMEGMLMEAVTIDQWLDRFA